MNIQKDAFLSELGTTFSNEKYTTEESRLKEHSLDESSFPPVLPFCAVFPSNEDDIVNVVKLCNKYNVPITARGSGTSLEGNSIPCKKGIVIALNSLDKVIQIYEEDLQVTVEPGVIYEKLNERLKYSGLFFPPSPGGSSDTATIGGMVSTNASGIYSVKYGGTIDWILELKVITGDGTKIKLGNRSFKRSSGYDLVKLIAGSEGTLAIITEITLKLAGIPEHRTKTAFKFRSEEDTTKVITEMSRLGNDIAAIEFIDSNTVKALNKHKNYNLDEQPVIFTEYHANTESAIKELDEIVNMLCSEYGGKRLVLKNNENPWEIRHHTTNAVKLFSTHTKVIRNDIAFPISKLPDIVSFIYQQTEKEQLDVFIFGHAGMGLLHPLIVVSENDEEKLERAFYVKDNIIKYAVEIGGTISGEHGIGIGHKKHLYKEHGIAVDFMKKIKKTFDPNNILNPGKIFDVD